MSSRASTANTDWQHIPASHPALPGHFPGAPIVPGVVLLDRVQQVLADAGLPIAMLTRVKFLQPLLPEKPFRVGVSGLDKQGGSFEVIGDDGAVVRGNWSAA